jgi:hypothetical protein
VVAAGPVQATVLTTQPQLAISKTLIDPPSGVAVVGDTVAFSVVITNTGTTTVTAAATHSTTTAPPASNMWTPCQPPTAQAVAQRSGTTWDH